MQDDKPTPRSFPLASNQREIWFDQILDPGMPHYNVGGYLDFPFAVDVALLKRAFETLVRRYDALRIRLRTNECGKGNGRSDGEIELPAGQHIGEADRHN